MTSLWSSCVQTTVHMALVPGGLAADSGAFRGVPIALVKGASCLGRGEPSGRRGPGSVESWVWSWLWEGLAGASVRTSFLFTCPSDRAAPV